jgi:nucleotide-binding universal stress UspA family protein
MLSIKTILHPTDFSDNSRAAFQLACALARDYGARLLVAHVARRPVITPLEGPVPPQPETYQEELTALLKGLQAAAPEVRMEPRLMLSEDPAGEILRLAAEVGCDLIVLGTHGRTGLGRVLLGSVAEQVLRRAPCPVLTVKMPPMQPAVGTGQAPAAETVGAL